MSKLVLHESTERHLTALKESPTHAIILTGPKGSGKSAVARQLAETLLDVSGDSLGDYAYKLLISPEDGKAISIESIRQLEHFLSLKVPRDTAINRVIIIEDSHLLTAEAQNALLKTLEEPPAGTVIILTATSERALLPTIRSRSRSIPVQTPSKTLTEQYFNDRGASEDAVQKAYAMSGGLPGLMQALVTDENHSLLAATDMARQLLQKPLFERVLLVDELAKQRELTRDTLFILQQMAAISLQHAEGRAAAKWRQVLQASFEASKSLDSNVQAKLVLTDLMLNL